MNDYAKIIKDKINELISGYPEPAKLLIIKHFEPAIKTADQMQGEIERLLLINSDLAQDNGEMQFLINFLKAELKTKKGA